MSSRTSSVNGVLPVGVGEGLRGGRDRLPADGVLLVVSTAAFSEVVQQGLGRSSGAGTVTVWAI